MLTDQISLTDGTTAIAYDSLSGRTKDGPNKYRHERAKIESLTDETPETFTVLSERGAAIRYTARVSSTEKDSVSGKTGTCYAQLTVVGQKGVTTNAALESAIKRLGNFITTTGNPTKIANGEI